MFGAGKKVADILAEYPGYHVSSLTSSRPRLAPQKVLRPGSTYHLTPVVSADGENGPLSPGGNGGEGTPRLRRESASFLRPTEAFGEVANDVALVHEGPHRGPSRRVSLDPGSLRRHATGSPRTSTRRRVIPRDPFTGLPATHEGSQPAESQPESQPALLSAAMVRAALTGSETQRSSAEETMWTPHMQHRYAGVQGAPSVQAPPTEPQQQQEQEQQGSATKVAVLERELKLPRGNQRKLADSPAAAVFPDFAVCYDTDEDVTKLMRRKTTMSHSKSHPREMCREWEPVCAAVGETSLEPYINATATYHSQPFSSIAYHSQPFHQTVNSPHSLSSCRKGLEQPVSSTTPSSCGDSSHFSAASVRSALMSSSPSASSSSSFASFSVFSSSSIQLTSQVESFTP
ncbi:unnamed protein product [Closterium sp. NIES-53]